MPLSYLSDVSHAFNFGLWALVCSCVYLHVYVHVSDSTCAHILHACVEDRSQYQVSSSIDLYLTRGSHTEP